MSISLTQGQDNPQLIFESMNSTGKSLSSADLIRNFVLMGHPDQDGLYKTYWRPIETTLGASTYDDVFDEFVRDWLTVLHAPEPLARRDVYQSFKRRYEDEGYGDGRTVEELLTLTAYNSELSDGTFREKKERTVGGFDVEWVAISGELKDADEWTPKSIGDRADRLAHRALEVWPAPLMEEVVRKSYLPEKKGASGARPITFKDIFSAGAIRAGDVLVSAGSKYRALRLLPMRGPLGSRTGRSSRVHLLRTSA